VAQIPAVVTRKDRLGFVGLGNLGKPMSQALIRDGWTLSVYDRDNTRAADLDAQVVESPADLAGCAVIALAVPDDEAVSQLVEDFLPVLAPGSVVLVHSTILPGTARRLAALLEDRGLGWLDAPVSGGSERALSGSLTLMAGGRAELLDRVRPVLESVADDVIHAGPAGAGSAVKLANQLMMFAALAGVQEALDLAGAYDVPERLVLDAVATSTGESWITRNWGFFDDVVAAYDNAGTPVRDRPWSKDLWDIVAAARERSLPLPVAGLLAQHLAGRVEEHAHKGAGS
jgi:3-hydroxyisobutyrate dehydrogenase